MAKEEVDHAKIALEVISRHGEMSLPGISSWVQVQELMIEAMRDLEAFYGEDVPEATEEEILDLDSAYEVLNTVRQELVDQGLGGNIARKHHLETAVAVFADIGVLLRAEEIIRESFDPREESNDAVSEDDHGDDPGEEPS
jgi:hypothetical protein